MQLDPESWEEQRNDIATQKWKDHVRWCEKQEEASRMCYHDKRIALDILVSEARRNHLRKLERDGQSQFMLHDAKKKWSLLKEQIAEDMSYGDNSGLVVKNLSCMCVFQPSSLCLEYGENFEERLACVERRRELIENLQQTNQLFVPGSGGGEGVENQNGATK